MYGILILALTLLGVTLSWWLERRDYERRLSKLKIRIYVNGTLQGTATNVVTWNATGELRVGGSAADFWHGAIDEVNVWNRVISPAEVLGRAAMLVGLQDEPRPVTAAELPRFFR